MGEFENKYTHKSVAIDDSGVSELGHKFAAEEAQLAADREAAGYLRPTAVLTVVGALRSDLLRRDIDRDRVTAGLEHLAVAGWKAPADEWLRMAADAYGAVLRDESAA